MIEVLGDELEVLLVSFFVNVLFVTGDLSVKMFIIHDKVPRQTKAPCSYLKDEVFEVQQMYPLLSLCSSYLRGSYAEYFPLWTLRLLPPRRLSWV